MFQNIEGVADGATYSKKKIKKLNLLANVFELRNIAIYVITFMISMVGF